MSRPRLTPLQAYNLLLDIEKMLPSKTIAGKYSVSQAMVSYYRKKYFVENLVRRPVEWPYVGKLPYYLRQKITHQ